MDQRVLSKYQRKLTINIEINILIFINETGIYHAFNVLGPGVGFLAGSSLLNFYVDIGNPDARYSSTNT